jgi:hypothetical protein
LHKYSTPAVTAAAAEQNYVCAHKRSCHEHTHLHVKLQILLVIAAKIAYNRLCCRNGIAIHIICRGVAQSGSARGLGPRGRRFKSCLPDHSRHFEPSLIWRRLLSSYRTLLFHRLLLGSKRLFGQYGLCQLHLLLSS